MKQEHVCGFILLPLFSLVAFLPLVFGPDVRAQVSDGGKVQRMSVALRPHPEGGFTNYQNFAAYPWQGGAVVPERPDGVVDAATGKRVLKWPILAYYPAAQYPMIVWYWEGSYRASNGSKWGTPEHWAYVRYAEEVWNPVAKQFEVPGLVAPAAPASGGDGVHIDAVAGQQLVDILKRSFTTQEIMDKMDRSPYDEPDTGAPEEGGSAPL